MVATIVFKIDFVQTYMNDNNSSPQVQAAKMLFGRNFRRHDESSVRDIRLEIFKVALMILCMIIA
jgi:hypothetical protein